MLSFIIAVVAAAPFLNEAYIAEINAVPGLKWRAAISTRFAGLSYDELPHPLARGVTFPPRPVTAPTTESEDPLPEAFSWVQERPECMGSVLDQGICGNCWAFATTEAFSDARCVHGRDESHVLYSVQYLTVCDKGSEMNACSGGNILFAATYMTEKGLPPAECVEFDEYTASSGVCPATCDDETAMPYATRAKGWKNVGTGGKPDVSSLKRAIVESGPLAACFNSYQSLFAYSEGIYEPLPDERPSGTHCCEIVGYGSEVVDGVDTPYWNVRNSWGPTWGEAGFFRVLRGQNTCQMEEDAASIFV